MVKICSVATTGKGHSPFHGISQASASKEEEEERKQSHSSHCHPQQHSDHLAISASHLCKLPPAGEQHGSEMQTKCSALLHTLQGMTVP
jgi:hypothetical protein